MSLAISILLYSVFSFTIAMIISYKMFNSEKKDLKTFLNERSGWFPAYTMYFFLYFKNYDMFFCILMFCLVAFIFYVLQKILKFQRVIQ